MIEILSSNNTIIEIKIAFDGCISRLNMARKRIKELEDPSVKTYQMICKGK